MKNEKGFEGMTAEQRTQYLATKRRTLNMDGARALSEADNAIRRANAKITEAAYAAPDLMPSETRAAHEAADNAIAEIGKLQAQLAKAINGEQVTHADAAPFEVIA